MQLETNGYLLQGPFGGGPCLPEMAIDESFPQASPAWALEWLGSDAPGVHYERGGLANVRMLTSFPTFTMHFRRLTRPGCRAG